MTFSTQLANELCRLNGYSADQPTTISLSAPGATLELDLTAVDRLSGALSELRVHVPALAAAGFDALKSWADALSKRITYLLEQIGPLELDPAAGEVLVRSMKPDTSSGRQFYEVLLKSNAAGTFSLRRYRSEPGLAGRTAVDMHLTHEVLQRLVRDVVETIPATA